jgi:ketosteroid isomerase-like protein
MNEGDCLAFLRRYYAAFGPDAAPATIEDFYHADAVQMEFPNQLAPNGVTRDVAAIKAAYERGRAILSSQRFELLNAVTVGDAIAVEASWEGTLAVRVGAIPAGTTMKARFAQFFELRNGRIRAQRNYDCFEPWQTARDAAGPAT